MKQSFAALVAGLLFGLGLVISHMIDPAKVLGFLDIAGSWDPSLAFVMAGAIPIAAIGFGATRARAAPILATRFQGPSRTRLDRTLVIGAALFGVGWGLVGYCPGPALTSLVLGRWQSWVFVAAMLVGMAGYGFLDRASALFTRRYSTFISPR
ncbi:MAG TPA: YeeE/YedE family protein [Stellaceae bacterium]|nr:YeeE/YedE family protein [Stellaceae bacterium]